VIDVTIEVLRKSCDLCVLFVCRRCCCDRSCGRDSAQKLRPLCCILVCVCVCVLLLLLRSNLRSRFCAKVATFVLDYCVCVVVVLIAIELTIEILCKTCGFLCGGGGRACVRACLSFLI